MGPKMIVLKKEKDVLRYFCNISCCIVGTGVGIAHGESRFSFNLQLKSYVC